MKVGVITPHQKGDRSVFLDRLKMYIERQTVKPDKWVIVDHDTGLRKDLTARLRSGLNQCRDCDLVLVMEDDDWYAPTYIERMRYEWVAAGRPDLIGIGETHYCHIGSGGHVLLKHPKRASLMSTGISTSATDRMRWPADDEVFVDIHLWCELGGKTFIPEKPISVGIKHGIGNTGGKAHNPNWSLYKKAPNMLASLIGSDAAYYHNLIKPEPNRKRIIAPIPVHGRLPLLKQTIRRLYDRNGVFKVICIGDEPQAQQVALNEGAEWVQHPNKPLGAKWNAGFIAAKKYQPDGVVFVGSSDWLSDDYLELASKDLDQFDIIGKLGCHFLDKSNSGQYRAVFWPGYGSGVRLDEPIGIGRILSARILDRIGWKPFDAQLDASLDWSMWNKVKRAGAKIKILPYLSGELVSISTDRWLNKHQFDDHWSNRLPSTRIDADQFVSKYPEIEYV